MRRKVLPGRCSYCGGAMLIPIPAKIEAEWARYKRAERAEIWVDGHCYLWDVVAAEWQLDVVRCDLHVEHASDPRKWVELRSGSGPYW